MKKKVNFKKIYAVFFNRETVLYAIFGILTTVLNIGLYQILLWFDIDFKLANVIALIITNIAAYVANKVAVFRSRSGSFVDLFGEFLRYIVVRGITMGIDFFGLIVLVQYLHIDKTVGKLTTTVAVVIVNYILGKLCVFINSEKQSADNV